MSDRDPFARYGRFIVEDEIHRIRAVLANERQLVGSEHIDPNLHLLLDNKVGILGAGVSGLYTALILDSLGIEYEILEVSDRIGGRLKTHKFPGGGEYDYYDAGAMRYRLPVPDDTTGKYKNGPMKRLADLIEYGPLNLEEGDRLKDKLIDYHYKVAPGSRPTFYYINGIHHEVGQTLKLSDFNAKAWGVDDAYVDISSSAIHNDVVQPFIEMLKRDLGTPGRKHGWSVMKEFDAFSMRTYMASKYRPSNSLRLPPRPLPNDIIDCCNLLQGSSGGYNRALTEAVFSEIAFANLGDDSIEFKWKCFQGGSETLSNAVHHYLEGEHPGSIKTSHRVTAIDEALTYFLVPSNYKNRVIPSDATRTVLSTGVIRIDIEDDNSPYRILERCTSVKVAVKGSDTPKVYGHVISTLPLPVLRTLDLRKAGLISLHKNALRALDHGPATKIAIRFKTNWWYGKLGIIGGQSYTDLPIRTIVYPSYGGAGNAGSKVLIASYAWTTDAFRLSALASKNHEALIELVLRNLAEAHHGVNGNYDVTYDYLVDQLAGREPGDELANEENFHVIDWLNEEYTMGAFPFFSPGEFGRFYAALSLPAAKGCLHFAGETVSIRHAWVVGALDSGWRAVREYLLLTKQPIKLSQFEELWSRNSEWVAAPVEVPETGAAAEDTAEDTAEETVDETAKETPAERTEEPSVVSTKRGLPLSDMQEQLLSAVFPLFPAIRLFF